MCQSLSSIRINIPKHNGVTTHKATYDTKISKKIAFICFVSQRSYVSIDQRNKRSCIYAIPSRIRLCIIIEIKQTSIYISYKSFIRISPIIGCSFTNKRSCVIRNFIDYCLFFDSWNSMFFVIIIDKICKCICLTTQRIYLLWMSYFSV